MSEVNQVKADAKKLAEQVVAYDAVVEAEYDRMEAEYRATLTAPELRRYRLWCQEIVEECPKCGTKDAEVEHDTGPDMVGCWWSTTCLSCNAVIESGSDGPEAVR